MTKKYQFQNSALFNKIKILSNPTRFKVLELSQGEGMSISSIAKHLKFKYKRCSEYIIKMEKEGILSKLQEGREKIVRSNVDLLEISKVLSK